MDVLLALLGVGIVVCVVILVVASIGGHRVKAAARTAVKAATTTPWTIAEVRNLVAPNDGGAWVTAVVIHRITDTGQLIGKPVTVATIRDDAPDWSDRMLTARAEAAERAAVLNSRP